MGQAFVANALVHGVVEILFCRLRQFVRWFVRVGSRCFVFPFVFIPVGGRDGYGQDRTKKQSQSNSEEVVESHVFGLPWEKFSSRVADMD
jgi:hypothetical protein